MWSWTCANPTCKSESEVSQGRLLSLPNDNAAVQSRKFVPWSWFTWFYFSFMLFSYLYLQSMIIFPGLSHVLIPTKWCRMALPTSSSHAKNQGICFWALLASLSVPFTWHCLRTSGQNGVPYTIRWGVLYLSIHPSIHSSIHPSIHPSIRWGN